MSTPPMPVRHAHKPTNLSKLATVFALTFSLAFGLCSVSGISISGGGNYRVGPAFDRHLAGDRSYLRRRLSGAWHRGFAQKIAV